MKIKQKIVALTGAGISAESGIKTFRDSNGLWEEHRVEDVATPEGWQRNKQLVLDFYNQRRRQLLDCKPNAAHFALADLQKDFDVVVITQNVDDLHERAGSKNIIHLHGELLKVRSTVHENLIYDWKKDLNLEDKCARGTQLRPHIVWFGEAVPMIETAAAEIQNADIVLVIGTSMQVYPAASLVHYAPRSSTKFYIDPNADEIHIAGVDPIAEKATTGMQIVYKLLMEGLSLDN